MRVLLRLALPGPFPQRSKSLRKDGTMNYLKIPLVILLAIGLTGALSLVSPVRVTAQAQSTALERGYRTGYSDGYTAGFRDVTDHAARDYQNKEDYRRADRSYNDTWGTIEDYRDGYQQGFEAGYASGYERAQFNSNLPTGLKRRGNNNVVSNSSVDNTTASNDTSAATNKTDVQTAPTQTGGTISIPRNTV